MTNPIPTPIPAEPEANDIHNVWTIYGQEKNGKESKRPLAMAGRPQDWGDPRWTYHAFRYTWLTSPSANLTYTVHCWTDLKRELGEYPALFVPLLGMAYQPGERVELCGRGFLADEDFWQAAWGPMPPLYVPAEDELLFAD